MAGAEVTGISRAALKTGLKEHRLPTGGEVAEEMIPEMIAALLPGLGQGVGKPVINFALRQLTKLGIKADSRMLAWIAVDLLNTKNQKIPGEPGPYMNPLPLMPDWHQSTPGFMPLMRSLQQAGFNPANPQPPPSHGK